MQLTKLERLILVNQFTILEKLDPQAAKASKEACEILRDGYTLEYDTLVSGFDTEVSEDKCTEVRDILDMYRALQNALRELPAGSVPAKDTTFQGFDGNEEGEHHAYAQFLIEVQGKWAESKNAPLNSHRPMIQRYRAMLREWKQSADKWHLTVEDVGRVVSQKG